MTTDKVTGILVDALKQAIAAPGEQRLYKSGKLPGLFPSRVGANAEAATRALQEGLLEVVRVESAGKTTEWVRATPAAIDHVHQHESPVHALHELRDLLQATHEGLPVWLSEIRSTLQQFVEDANAELGRWRHRLNVLGERVEEAIRRSEVGKLASANGDTTVPWTADAIEYLDRRRDIGATHDCPFPELYAALRPQHADITIKGFHEGLRRLQERRALSLVPFTGLPSQLSQPEFALLDGAAVLYYAAR